jgi:non-ribosomal peptide synthetase component E (peptide arylation enzyme)
MIPNSTITHQHPMHPAQTSNLARLLTHTAQLFPERAGLIQGEARWTWGEIEQRVAAMTAALRALGLKKGDRILLGKDSVTEIKVEGEEHLILKEEDVLGVLEGK